MLLFLNKWVKSKTLFLFCVMSLKIVIASFDFYPAQHGIAQVAFQHAFGLHQLGYDVTVVTQPLSKQVPKFPFKLVCFPIHYRKFSLRPKTEQEKDYQTYLLESNADIFFFHCWETWGSELALPLWQHIRGKTVLVSHGTTLNLILPGVKGWIRWLVNRPLAWRFPEKLKKFDHYVFLSHKPDPLRMTDVVWFKRLSLPNFSVIPNAAQPDFDIPTSLNFKQHYGISTSNMLLCVSNFMKSKGQHQLIKWFLEMNLEDTALILIGSHVNLYTKKLKKLASTKLNKTIFIFDKLSQSHIKAAYHASTLFVSATFTEVQPLVLLDSMAAGVPFVCRDVGSVSELAGGMCFRTSEQFKKQVFFLLQHSHERMQLSEAGKKAYHSDYNWQKVIKTYDELIKKLVS